MEKPSPAIDVHTAVHMAGPEGVSRVASGRGPGAGAISLKSLRVRSVAGPGPLLNYFGPQRYFSKFMFMRGSSKLGYGLGGLRCPHHTEAANNCKTDDVLSAGKERSSCQKNIFLSRGNNPVRRNLLAVCWPDIILLPHPYENSPFCRLKSRVLLTSAANTL